jgi:hypothetical protein
MTPGLQLTIASMSAFFTSKFRRLNTFSAQSIRSRAMQHGCAELVTDVGRGCSRFKVAQLYSFCRREFAEL